MRLSSEPESTGLTIRSDDADVDRSGDPDGYFSPSAQALLANHFDLGHVETELRARITRAKPSGLTIDSAHYHKSESPLAGISKHRQSGLNAVTSPRFRDAVKTRGAHLPTLAR